MRRCRDAVWVRCSQRNLTQPAGPAQRRMRDRSGETPCMAATARAMSHSKSDQSGAMRLGEASSRAIVSVVLRKAAGSAIKGSPAEFSSYSSAFIRSPGTASRFAVPSRGQPFESRQGVIWVKLKATSIGRGGLGDLATVALLARYQPLPAALERASLAMVIAGGIAMVQLFDGHLIMKQVSNRSVEI